MRKVKTVNFFLFSVTFLIVILSYNKPYIREY